MSRTPPPFLFVPSLRTQQHVYLYSIETVTHTTIRFFLRSLFILSKPSSNLYIHNQESTNSTCMWVPPTRGSAFSSDYEWHSKRSLQLPSRKHVVYPISGVATAMLMYIPALHHVDRSVRTNHSFKDIVLPSLITSGVLQNNPCVNTHCSNVGTADLQYNAIALSKVVSAERWTQYKIEGHK
jgi:hypothetical protein